MVDDTELVVIVNAPLVAPAGIFTLAGTVAAALLLEMLTTAPPAGAAEVNVTVPCEVFPPVTDPGFNVIVESAAAGAGVGVGGGGVGLGGGGVGDGGGCPVELTPRVTLFVTPPAVPEIGTVVDVATGLVATVKRTNCAPAGTVALAGTVAMLVSPLARETVTPLAGAGALIQAVPSDVLPPSTVAGKTSIV